MKTMVLAIYCLLAFVVTSSEIYAQDYISMLLKPQLQKDCGIHKLSASERASLNNVIRYLASSSSSDLGDSAVSYLENEGWEKVKVLGSRNLKLEGDFYEKEYLFVEKSPWIYILEPKGYSMLSPGEYLGQMSYTSCEIIDHSGDDKGFWTKDTK